GEGLDRLVRVRGEARWRMAVLGLVGPGEPGARGVRLGHERVAQDDHVAERGSGCEQSTPVVVEGEDQTAVAGVPESGGEGAELDALEREADGVGAEACYPAHTGAKVGSVQGEALVRHRG